MKKTIDFKKGSELFTKSAETVSGVVGKTSELSKKLAAGTQSTISSLSEKAKNDRYQRDLKKYNPLFPEEYAADTFNLPNIIMIRDDAERRGIEVCEGAIGWREKTKDNVEILFLYDEFVPLCGLHFIPAPECDAIYHVDHFDRTRFIRTDTIFHKIHEEKLAELRNVAYCLGAKSCSVEIIETEAESNASRRNSSSGETVKFGPISADANVHTEQQSANLSNTSRGGTAVSEWSGDQAIVQPELKWFRHEETILKLIETRLSGGAHIRRETLTLEGSSSATMTRKAAVAVDAAASKFGIGGASKNAHSMEAEVAKESRSKLIFHIEF